MNREIYPCSIIPFEHQITGVDTVDFSKPTFFYGSTLLPILAKSFGNIDNIFWEDVWWNPLVWTKHRTDMINSTIVKSTVGELREKWISTPTFIKPINVKSFTGMVIEGAEDKDWWMTEYSDLSSDLEICCSQPVNIEREWRFWIIDNKVVAGSLYKKYGILTTKEVIPAEIYEAAQSLADGWLPHKTIVMDIAELRNGEIRIVEFNSINSSGFYNADIEKIILALENQNTSKVDV